MRSYIFTEYERKLLREWLSEKAEKSIALRKVLSRIRLAERLKQDIQLFLEAQKRL